ncbi:MAG TPA: hypothetical protein DCL44_11005 [Elusimicrobia bacterium]|nr:hypothetical protein [Elusimicrobiota bacterium]
MAKRILLIASSFEEVPSIASKGVDTRLSIKLTDLSHYPLGLGYVYSYLEAAGHEVRSLWMNNHPFEVCLKSTIETINRFKPAIIGLQIMTANRTSSYRLIEYIHQHYPDIQLVIGGIHATVMYKQLVLKYPFIIVVTGEGELTFAELAEKLPGANAQWDDIKGIAFYRDNGVVSTQPRELIEDLDALPFPKHEAFFDPQRTYGCIVTSRGCPFSCSFCCLEAITRRKVRMRSVANVMAEIEFMIKTFPRMRMLFIHDDTFFLDNKRVIEFCDEVVRRGIKLDFICSGRVKPLSAEMIRKLEQANFKKVLLGLESGDEGVLKACRKGITLDDVVNAFQLFARSSIDVYAFLIVGLPGENETTVANTIKLIKRLQKIKYIYYDNFSTLTVYPGTDVYEMTKRAGVLNDDFWLSDKLTPLYTLENSPEQLLELREILLNHISLDRFFTLPGFKAQVGMLPYIAPYVLRYVLPLKLLRLAVWILRPLLPARLYNKVRSLYRSFFNLADN